MNGPRNERRKRPKNSIIKIYKKERKPEKINIYIKDHEYSDSESDEEKQ